MAERTGPVREKFLTKEAEKETLEQKLHQVSLIQSTSGKAKEASKAIPKAPVSRNMEKSMASLDKKLSSQLQEQASTNQQVALLLTSLRDEMTELRKERKSEPRKRKPSKPPPSEPSAVRSQFPVYSNEESEEEEDQNRSDEEEDEKSTRSETGEEEEEQSALQYGRAKVSALEVLPEQLAKWSVYRQMAKQYDEQAWKQVKATKLVTKYTSLPTGQEFRAHEKDLNSPSLKFESQKQAEAALKVQEGLAGAVGASQTAVLVMVEGLVANLKKAQQSFSESEEAVDKEEALLVLKDVQTGLRCIGAHSENAAKLAAVAFNKALVARRKPVLDSINSKQTGLKEKMAKLRPGEKLLFGGKIDSLAKAQRDINSVSFITLFVPFP